MPKKTYSSGNPDGKSDFYIEYSPSKSGGMKLDIQSRDYAIFIQYRMNEFDELLATEIERLN